MNKFLLLCILAYSLSACDPKPFVEHKISATRQSENCAVVSSNFKLISNIGGERYEFSKCLPAGFDKEQVSVTRAGDTVLVRFPPVGTGEQKAAFAITLDIDSYPQYHFLTIDDETYSIGHSDSQ
jgi:hypothetical protein